MPIEFKIQDKDLTNITDLRCSLTIEGGDARREARAMEVEITRTVGRNPGDGTDILSFKTLSGGTLNASPVPVKSAVKLETNFPRLIGSWQFGQCAIQDFAVSDTGHFTEEATTFRTRDVTYTRADGKTSDTLKV